jgi:hypothetical protein
MISSFLVVDLVLLFPCPGGDLSPPPDTFPLDVGCPQVPDPDAFDDHLVTDFVREQAVGLEVDPGPRSALRASAFAGGAG